MILFLSDWLKKIILLILLATFIDLLLPNSSIQRYVKLVIGLFVLMTILSPVLTLFQTGWNITDPYWLSGKVSPQSGIKSLDSIQSDAKQLQSRQQDDMRAMVESQLQDQIRQQIETQFAYETEKVGVFLDMQNDEWVMQSIQVELSRASPEAGEKRSAEGIQPVEPVVVQIGEQTVESLPMLRHNDVQADLNKDIQSIREALSQMWRLPEEQVEVTIQPEYAEGR